MNRRNFLSCLLAAPFVSLGLVPKETAWFLDDALNATTTASDCFVGQWHRMVNNNGKVTIDGRPWSGSWLQLTSRSFGVRRPNTVLEAQWARWIEHKELGGSLYEAKFKAHTGDTGIISWTHGVQYARD